jgi:hypothetical protein
MPAVARRLSCYNQEQQLRFLHYSNNTILLFGTYVVSYIYRTLLLSTSCCPFAARNNNYSFRHLPGRPAEWSGSKCEWDSFVSSICCEHYRLSRFQTSSDYQLPTIDRSSLRLFLTTRSLASYVPLSISRRQGSRSCLRRRRRRHLKPTR